MIQTIIVILIVLASDAALYFLLSKKIVQSKPEPVVIKEAHMPHPADSPAPDNKETNDERRYMEGIQAILSYSADTMKQYLKGVDEE